MLTFFRGDKIRRELIKESLGNFRVVHMALHEAARDRGTNVMAMEDVKARIRRILAKENG